MKRISYKGGYGVHRRVRVSIHLKEELAFTTNKRLWVISNLKVIPLLNVTRPAKNNHVSANYTELYFC